MIAPGFNPGAHPTEGSALYRHNFELSISMAVASSFRKVESSETRTRAEPWCDHQDINLYVPMTRSSLKVLMTIQ
jgi:hypothetical protein